MTEDEARSRVAAIVPRETMAHLEALANLVVTENGKQNLIAPSTVGKLWERHILDSAQLLVLGTGQAGIWLDIGSGAGFPGLVVGVVRQEAMILVEPRAKRAAFLVEAAGVLGIADRVEVIQSRVQTAMLDSKAAVISARAVAALPALFEMALGHASAETVWLLPKGKTAANEVAEARNEWQGDIRLEPSMSDPDSAIVVARNVRRKKSR